MEYQVLEMLVQVQGLPELLSEFKTSLGSLWKLYLKIKMWKESWGYGSMVRDLATVLQNGKQKVLFRSSQERLNQHRHIQEVPGL